MVESDPKPPQMRRAGGRPPGLALDAELLRARRQALAMSQEALAERAGVATRTLQNAEGGVRVSPQIAAALAAALGVELSALTVYSGQARAARLAERLVEAGFAPPPPVAHVGRAAERRWLADRFGPGAQVCIVGLPGSGKSALAADLVASAPGSGPTCWVDATRLERSDPVSAMLSLARCLGFSEALPNPNLVPPDALARAFRKAFWALCPTLVIDDARSLDAIALLVDLAARPRLVVTTPSRSVARGLPLECLELGPLATGDALELLAASRQAARAEPVGPFDDLEVAAAHELIALIGRSPRALRVVGRQLARDDFSRLPDYLQRLTAALALRAAPPGAEAPAHTGDFEPAFLATWLGLEERLPQPALDALGALSIFERRRVPIEWALSAIGGGPAEARASLGRLHDLHLVTRLGPDTVGLDAEAQRIARTLPAGPALDRLVAFAIPRSRVALSSPSELQLCVLLIDALCDALAPSEVMGPLPRPEDLTPLEPPQLARASLLLALGVPLLPALVMDHAPAAGRRLVALARAATSVEHEALRDVTGALGTWLLACAGQHRLALLWLEHAITLSLARGDARTAGRLAAQRAPAGYYLGDPEQGLGDIRRAIAYAECAGDLDGARGSRLMHAIGVAHMRGAWDEALAELRACTDPTDSPHGATLAALAQLDLAVCERALGLPCSAPRALGLACDHLERVARGAPFDAAGIVALKVVLGVREHPGLNPADVVSGMLESVEDAHRASTLMRLDILADAFSAWLAPSPSHPPFAADHGTAAIPFMPGSVLQSEVGHHLPLMVPLEPFRFLLAPSVLEVARDIAAEQLGDDHPLCTKLAALAGCWTRPAANDFDSLPASAPGR